MPSVESEKVRKIIKEQSAAMFGADVPLEERRAAMDHTGVRVKLLPGQEIEPVRVGGISGEWLNTPGSDTSRVLFYLHGGGYVLGSMLSHRRLLTNLAKASGSRLLAIDYRLAPENPFPAGLEDSIAAYRWLLAEGYRPEHIVIGGDSAGGGLALATLLKLREAGDPLPAGAILLSPWLDLTLSGESIISQAEADPMLNLESSKLNVRRYLGENNPRNPLASPLYGELRGLPPMLIQVGTDEIVLDDSTRFAERARTAGVELELDIWEGMWHVWQMFAGLMPESSQAIEQLGAFVRQRTGLSTST